MPLPQWLSLFPGIHTYVHVTLDQIYFDAWTIPGLYCGCAYHTCGSESFCSNYGGSAAGILLDWKLQFRFPQKGYLMYAPNPLCKPSQYTVSEDDQSIHFKTSLLFWIKTMLEMQLLDTKDCLLRLFLLHCTSVTKSSAGWGPLPLIKMHIILLRIWAMNYITLSQHC